MRSDDMFNSAKLLQPAILMAFFWVIAVVLWQTTGTIFYLYNFLYLGTAIGVGVGLYTALPRRQKHWGRRLSQFFMGGYLLLFLGLIKQENMQIEGFFFYLMAGFFGGSLIHYLVAKIVGPLLFNRAWCAWSCWTAMVLDFLPYRRNTPGRLGKQWGYLRYIHFGLSLGLVLVLWFGLDYRVGGHGATAFYWLLGGNIFYYASSITMAYLLKDNRAFCKYLCPIPVVQKIPSRFALLKVAGDAEKCNECGACIKVCPMDIRIPEYIKNGQRVLSTECIFCLECASTFVRKVPWMPPLVWMSGIENYSRYGKERECDHRLIIYTMKIVAICGSPRKGNTYSALNAIQEQHPDIDYKVLMLHKMNFEMCRGCYVCILQGEEKCPLNDDRDMMINEMLDADGVILASPVYSHMVSATMKNFFDRLGFYAHRPRFFDKYAMSIATCSGYGAEEALKYMDKMLKVFGFNLVPPLELQFQPGKLPEKNKIENHKKTIEAANTLIARIEKGGRDEPSLGMLIPFKIFKYVSEIDTEVMKADYEYYKDKTDYYYDTKMPFFKKMIANRVVKKIIQEFD